MVDGLEDKAHERPLGLGDDRPARRNDLAMRRRQLEPGRVTAEPVHRSFGIQVKLTPLAGEHLPRLPPRKYVKGGSVVIENVTRDPTLPAIAVEASVIGSILSLRTGQEYDIRKFIEGIHYDKLVRGLPKDGSFR